MLKNITFSADDYLIKKAREKAVREHKTLNVIFRNWLAEYVHQNKQKVDYRHLMKKLNYVTPGRKFSRGEMNER